MLTPDKIRYENGVEIYEKIIPDSAKATKYVASWVPKGGSMKPRYFMEPIGVTMHNTNDLKNVNDDAEQYTRATWPNCNMGGVVVHYYVDDIRAWQNLRENESGWHASDNQGDGNRRTIAIECIMDGSGSEADLKARDNAARLAASILFRYGWTTANLYTHNHWKGLEDKIVPGANKNCPVFLLPNWSGFKSLVNSYLIKLKHNNSSLKEEEKETDNTNNTVKYEDISEGDMMQFLGSSQYVSASNLAKSSAAKPSRVKVTKKTLSTLSHPIHVRSIDDKENFISGVYGWVDLKDLTPIIKVPFTVKVTSDNLNYRSGPGISYAIKGTIKDKGVYTIIEVSNGWGKLKSGAGWISLKYTKKL